MECPKCKSDLKPENYEGVEIDRCVSCSGTWLDDDELIKIINNREEKFSDELIHETFALAFTGVPKKEQHSLERCPKCSKAMNAINYNYSSGIIIDRCPDDCGIWLDHCELEKIQVHIEENEKEFEKNKDAWLSLANSAKESKKEVKDKMNQKESSADKIYR